MTDFLRRHWFAVSGLLVLGLFLADARCDANRLDGDLMEARENIAAANARTVDAVARANRLSVIADSLETEAEADADTAEVYITRWRTRVDTLTVTEVVALADSTINACSAALTSCRMATGALRDVVEAKDSAMVAGNVERAALRDYVTDLEGRLTQDGPLWPTLVAVGGGAGIGYAADGILGAAFGAGVGLSVDVVRRGFMDLMRSF